LHGEQLHRLCERDDRARKKRFLSGYSRAKLFIERVSRVREKVRRFDCVLRYENQLCRETYQTSIDFLVIFAQRAMSHFSVAAGVIDI